MQKGTAMNSAFNNKWRNYQFIAVLILLFVSGIVIINDVNRAGNNVANNVDTLIEQQLPQIELFHQIQNNVKELELILYRYYETTDSDSYQLNWQRYHHKNDALIINLKSKFVIDVKQYMLELTRIATDFDTEMRSPDRDWNLLREHLATSKNIGLKFDHIANQATDDIYKKFKQKLYIADFNKLRQTYLS